MGVKKFKLKDNHSWKSKPGNSICVLDHGVVRFDYPSHWVLKTQEGAVLLHDREPSIESCDLGVSIFRMPGEIIADLPLEEMLVNSLGAERNPYQQSEIHQVQRADVEIAWLEQKYVDAGQNRDARFRVALARGSRHLPHLHELLVRPGIGAGTRLGRGAALAGVRLTSVGPDGGPGRALTRGLAHINRDVLRRLRLDSRLLQKTQIAKPVDEAVLPRAVGRVVTIRQTAAHPAAVSHGVAGMAALRINMHFEIRRANSQHRGEVFVRPDGMNLVVGSRAHNKRRRNVAWNRRRRAIARKR